MEAKQEVRKAQFKDISTALNQKKFAKADSDDARKELISSLRQLVEPPSEESLRRKADMKTKKLFSRTFMHPDTMLEVPENLSSDWSLIFRPEGERCLVVVNGNTVTLRGRNGNIIETIVLDPFSVKRSETVTILDGVYGYKGLRKCVYVFDALLLKQSELIFSDFDFRQFFLSQHWPFTESVLAPMLDSEIPELVRIEAVPATASNVRRLYESESGDSLVFFKRTAKYINALTQEALCFRDERISRYAIDSQHKDGFQGNEAQTFVLRRAERKSEEEALVEFKTWDNVVLFTSRSGSDSHRNHAKESSLVKVTVNAQFELLSFKSSGKPFAHSFSRIVDQFRKRRSLLGLAPIGVEVMDAAPVSIDQILHTLV